MARPPTRNHPRHDREHPILTKTHFDTFYDQTFFFEKLSFFRREKLWNYEANMFLGFLEKIIFLKIFQFFGGGGGVSQTPGHDFFDKNKFWEYLGDKKNFGGYLNFFGGRMTLKLWCKHVFRVFRKNKFFENFRKFGVGEGYPWPLEPTRFAFIYFWAKRSRNSDDKWLNKPNYTLFQRYWTTCGWN